MARTWLVPKSERFFWPEISGLGRKIRFLPYDPNFGQQLVALRGTVHFPPWERFFYFPFPSYGRFRKKAQTRQKVFPLPTVRAPSASNSPSALSEQALWRKNIVGEGRAEG